MPRQLRRFSRNLTNKLLLRIPIQVTSLIKCRARSSFPEFMVSDPFFSESLAKSVNYIITENLLTVLPQLDDYTCPVCASITFKPIRLSCGHVFCIRCLIKLQRQQKSHCPICRRDVVMQADSTNVDEKLLAFLRLYFPKETKAKQLENEKALGLDQLEKVGFGKGEGKECIIM
jgi:E3 ubiquitin-protein ligase BAH